MMDFHSPAEGIACMKSQGVDGLLDKVEEMFRRLPATDDLGMMPPIVAAHVASLMGRHETAEYIISRVQTPGRYIWNDYARAMHCLVTKQPYELEEAQRVTYIGSMKYRVPYLAFISDITNGRDLTGSLEVMRQMFLKRQTDKRLAKEDGGRIVEGSAKHQTHWDFRAEGLKAYATYKYGITFAA